MSGGAFFGRIVPEIHQMLGNLFSRNQPIDFLEKMTYKDLCYWNNWHKLMSKEENKITDDIEKKGKGKKR